MVVAVALIGSLTVLPALLSKLGDKVEKGRVPFIGAGARRNAASPAPVVVDPRPRAPAPARLRGRRRRPCWSRWRSRR